MLIQYVSPDHSDPSPRLLQCPSGGPPFTHNQILTDGPKCNRLMLRLGHCVSLSNVVWYCHPRTHGNLSPDSSHLWFPEGGPSYRALSEQRLPSLSSRISCSQSTSCSNIYPTSSFYAFWWTSSPDFPVFVEQMLNVSDCTEFLTTPLTCTSLWVKPPN